MEPPRIELDLDSVTYRYGRSLAVEAISARILPGGVAGIVGPTGAGKSTLLALMGAILRPTAGEVRFRGRSTSTHAEDIRRQLGYLPQCQPQWPEARVGEFLHFRAALKDIPRRRQHLEVGRVMAAAGLQGLAPRLIGRLSHGFQRRVGLADALLADPPLLLLDEPTAGLDAASAREVCTQLKSLAGERIVVLTTHLLAEAEATCTRVLVMVAGRQVDDVVMADLHGGGFEAELHAPASDVLNWAAACGAPAQATTLADGWVRVTVAGADQQELFGLTCADRGWILRELRAVHHSLEERIVRHLVRGRAA